MNSTTRHCVLSPDSRRVCFVVPTDVHSRIEELANLSNASLSSALRECLYIGLRAVELERARRK